MTEHIPNPADINAKNLEKALESRVEKDAAADTHDYTRAEKAFAALAYAGPFAIVSLVFAHESRFAGFHARQGLLLCALFWAASHFFFFLSLPHALDFFQLLLAVTLGYFCLMGKMFRLPLLADMADQLRPALQYDPAEDDEPTDNKK